MARFVSALGPDEEPGDIDVKYHSSAPNYEDAKKLCGDLRGGLDGSKTSVIYRLSYDPAQDRFFSWRQAEGSLGTAKDDADPTDVALAYEIFSTPKSLLDSEEGQRLLNQQVDLIATHSQTVKPGNAGPPK